jgi:hypothetical protein
MWLEYHTSDGQGKGFSAEYEGRKENEPKISLVIEGKTNQEIGRLLSFL